MNRKRIRKFDLRLPAMALAMIAGACQPVLANAASFDCRKVVTLVETAICADPELSKADEELAAVYRELVARKPDQKEVQRRWLHTVRDRCKDVACLRKAYEDQDIELRISLEPDDDEPMTEPAPAQRARR